MKSLCFSTLGSQPSTRHLCRCALSALVLALPWSGIVPLASAQAQDSAQAQAQVQATPPLPTKIGFRLLSFEQKAAIDRAFMISHQTKVCQSHVNFQVQNATLEDVVKRVKALLPNQTVSLEVRGADAVQVGFDLKDERVGDILEHVAGLSGCKLWVLGSGLLIAPESLLTGAERTDMKHLQGGEWARYGHGWTVYDVGDGAFVDAIAYEVTGSAAKPFPATVLKTTFGDFAPESQTLLQQLAQWRTEERLGMKPIIPPLQLQSDSVVTVDTSRRPEAYVWFGDIPSYPFFPGAPAFPGGPLLPGRPGMLGGPAFPGGPTSPGGSAPFRAFDRRVVTTSTVVVGVHTKVPDQPKP